VNSKKRLDLILAERGYFSSRDQAKAAVMAGQVFVNGERVDKPGTILSMDIDIQCLSKQHPYVSRGGLKLEKAINEFKLVFNGKTVLDVGASTGGFTHCALIHGAERVIAIDVGYGQIAWELRNDPRVCLFEKTNIRYVIPEKINCLADVATIDVSFISLNKVLPAVSNLIKKSGCIVALVKPQFEAGPAKVGKKGVVTDKEVHIEVLESVIISGNLLGFFAQMLTYSPIRGPKGNIEYLIKLSREENNQTVGIQKIRQVVAEAYTNL
jgi:23S rRNA (cytidine1920-2'-O)/16S rRNA (cytidine1409-2'-O)-methyltransferase